MTHNHLCCSNDQPPKEVTFATDCPALSKQREYIVRDGILQLPYSGFCFFFFCRDHILLDLPYIYIWSSLFSQCVRRRTVHKMQNDKIYIVV